MNQQPNRTPRPPQQRSNPPSSSGYVSSQLKYRKRKKPVLTGTLIYAILFLLVILISLFIIVKSRSGERDPEETDPIEETETTKQLPSDTEVLIPVIIEDPEFVGPPALQRKPDAEYIETDNAQIAVGNMILVNYQHAYVFPESQPQTVFYGNKSKAYQLSRSDHSINTDLFPIFDGMISDFAAATGSREVLVTSAYRSYETQDTLYKDTLKNRGEEYTSLYVAKPGHSEHHAGLAVDMVIFSGGQQYYFPQYEKASWIIEHAPDYGFFLRYTEENQAITGCAPEPWHYRYVGIPHARLITTLNISFEEYHTYLQQFTWEGKRLLIAEDGSVSETDGLRLPTSGHMVYYVPAAENSSSTKIPVPPEYTYEISGDNMNGFIVTVTLH